MESNKDRQYRTDHDRCWYTVKVKLALLAHRPIPERRNPSPPAPALAPRRAPRRPAPARIYYIGDEET